MAESLTAASEVIALAKDVVKLGGYITAHDLWKVLRTSHGKAEALLTLQDMPPKLRDILNYIMIYEDDFCSKRGLKVP